MTEENQGTGHIRERIDQAVTDISGGDANTLTGSDAVAQVPTAVSRAAGNPVDDADAGSGGTGADPAFGPTEGGLSDILPGGGGPGTDEDDRFTDRLSRES